MRKRRDERDAPAARILRAAKEEFARRGFSGSRVEAIGRRAGVNPALVLYYFKSKDALYGALLREIFGEFDREDLIVRLRDFRLGPPQKLYIAVYLIVRLFLKPRDPDYYRIVFHELADGSPHLRKMALEFIIPERRIGRVGDHGRDARLARCEERQGRPHGETEETYSRAGKALPRVRERGREIPPLEVSGTAERLAALTAVAEVEKKYAETRAVQIGPYADEVRLGAVEAGTAHYDAPAGTREPPPAKGDPVGGAEAHLLEGNTDFPGGDEVRVQVGALLPAMNRSRYPRRDGERHGRKRQYNKKKELHLDRSPRYEFLPFPVQRARHTVNRYRPP